MGNGSGRILSVETIERHKSKKALIFCFKWSLLLKVINRNASQPSSCRSFCAKWMWRKEKVGLQLRLVSS